jgi:hypothetical protein
MTDSVVDYVRKLENLVEKFYKQIPLTENDHLFVTEIMDNVTCRDPNIVAEMKQFGPGNIKAAGYNVDKKLMKVEFSNGFIYHYFNVPDNIFGGLVVAEHRTKYLNENIKGKFNALRIA